MDQFHNNLTGLSLIQKISGTFIYTSDKYFTNV